MGAPSLAMLPSPPVQAVDLADRLHSAAIHLLRRLRRSDPQTGVSAAQLSALSVLMGGPRTIGELASAEQVRPPTISRVIRELEALGMVTRSTDARDGRVVWIASTASGQEVLARGRALRVTALTQAIAALSEAERATLTAGLGVFERVLAEL
jgi:DNA-binding MarR family transcriptional regulator